MATKSKWNAKLAKANSSWADSEESYKATFGADNLPEDVFVFKLQDLEFAEVGKDNSIAIRREHVVLEGEFKGTVVRDRFNLDNEWGAVFCRRWLNMVGQEAPKSATELEPIIDTIKADPYVCKARFSRKNGYPNLDVISIITEEDEDGGSGETQEIDLDSMDRADLRELVESNSLDIEGYKKMNEDDLRNAIKAMISDGGDGGSGESGGGEDGGDEVDLSKLDRAGLLDLVESNGVDATDLGFKNKLLMKKASEKDLRKALEKYMEDNSGDDSGSGGGNADDELLEKARIFCSTWDIEGVKPDSDLDDYKTAIGKCEFPAKEVDETDRDVLTELGLESCIKEPKSKPKLSLKKGKK